MFVSASLRPFGGASIEEPLHGLATDPLAGLRDGALRDRPCLPRQSEIQFRHDIFNGPVSEHPYAEDERDDLLRRQTTTTNRRSTSAARASSIQSGSIFLRKSTSSGGDERCRRVE